MVGPGAPEVRVPLCCCRCGSFLCSPGPGASLIPERWNDLSRLGLSVRPILKPLCLPSAVTSPPRDGCTACPFLLKAERGLLPARAPGLALAWPWGGAGSGGEQHLLGASWVPGAGEGLWVSLLPAPPQVHAHIISYLKKEMPSVFGKENKKKQLIAKLPVIFAKIQLEHQISPGDFPDCEQMQKQLIAKLPVIFAKIQLEHQISPGDFPDCEQMQVSRAQGWAARGSLERSPGGLLEGRGGGCGRGLPHP
uniref:DUF5600 domain-containing protein n=1 Tax=Sarcophilus harrisii TaxID=9305 RepID=A0A7N4Q046_SARHA